MNSISKKIDLQKIFISISLTFIILRRYLISFVNPDVDINSLKSILFYSSILILVLFFILEKNKNITEILLVGICGLLYVINREGAILLIVLLAVASKHIDDNYIVKNYLLISVILLVASIALFNIFPGLESNQEVHYRYIKKTDSLVPRLDYGLGNPNAAFYHMITIYGAYIFLRFKKYNKWDRLILFGSSIFVYLNTYSRTGFFTILAGLILVEIVRLIDIKKVKILEILIKISPIILTILSLILGIIFNKNYALNRFLASRPKYWHVYLMEEGSFFRLFGNKYSYIVKSSNPLDNSYVYIISMLGVVSFILFAYLMYKGMQSLIQKNKKQHLVVVLMFLVYSFAENLLLEAAFSFGVVLLIKEIIINDNTNIKQLIRRR